MWLFRTTVVLLFSSIVSSCSFGSKCVDIYPDGIGIPMYPNAQNIVQEEPIIDWRKTYTWTFTTSDQPEDVWQFYVNEVTAKWDGMDTTSPKTPEQRQFILEEGCSFTYLEMTYTLIDNAIYRITIQLVKEPRM